MRTAFIETSAINWLHANEFGAANTNELFTSLNFTPIMGMDTIYELARCFIVKHDKAISLFSFLKQLNPIYSCQRSVLYDQEIHRLIKSSIVDPLLGYYTEEILTERIKQYSAGDFDNTHAEFIAGRQFFWDDCREKLWKPENVKQKKGLTSQDYLAHCFQQIETTPPNITAMDKKINRKNIVKRKCHIFAQKY